MGGSRAPWNEIPPDVPPHDLEYMLPMFCLLRGFLRERRGEVAGTQQARKAGLQFDRINPVSA